MIHGTVSSQCAVQYVHTPSVLLYLVFFFNDTATTEIYTLSLHDALPTSGKRAASARRGPGSIARQAAGRAGSAARRARRSEEHTSELQSRPHLVCRLLLEKKKKKRKKTKKKKKKKKKSKKKKNQQKN